MSDSTGMEVSPPVQDTCQDNVDTTAQALPPPPPEPVENAILVVEGDFSNSPMRRRRPTDVFRRVVNGKTIPQCFKCRRMGHVAKFCRGAAVVTEKPTLKLFYKLLLDAKSKHGVKTLYCCICRQPSGSECFCSTHA